MPDDEELHKGDSTCRPCPGCGAACICDQPDHQHDTPAPMIEGGKIAFHHHPTEVDGKPHIWFGDETNPEHHKADGPPKMGKVRSSEEVHARLWEESGRAAVSASPETRGLIKALRWMLHMPEDK